MNVRQSFKLLVLCPKCFEKEMSVVFCTKEQGVLMYKACISERCCCLIVPLSQFVKTILSQGHLTPLPLYVSPVYWAYDNALRVYPVPDVIIFADKYDPFSISNSDCLCINPVLLIFFLGLVSRESLINMYVLVTRRQFCTESFNNKSISVSFTI